ncbi:hypothetical protein HK100_006348 [Physocladia obscura]|uniref:Uncharacterized protein n=1 Tax=Physocladia obscura TaxID=109957 RepID=A0AAD5XG63_9FUNG|nr:hypothetical protein HK100_006348 [Physocladia obscura]
MTFWFSVVATISNWYGGSVEALGLSMWEALGCAFGGQLLISVIIVLNGRAGTAHHIGFPVLNRSAFGIYGGLWPTFSRAVISIVWNGVNAVQGGQSIYVMLRAIFPTIADISNTIGSGSALTSGEMIEFAIFFIITCCFLIIPVSKMKGLVYSKLVVFIISELALLILMLILAGGIGPVASQGSTVSGPEKSRLIVRFFFLGAANCATFASNASDFQRYAGKKTDVIFGNVLGFLLSNLIVGIVGNIVYASSQVVFGELICPWYLLGIASIFISFLSSYQIFLLSITGVLLANYYLVARGYLKIPDLFSDSKHGAYYFFHGFGIQAFVAYIIGIIPSFYGFLNNIGINASNGVVKTILSAGTYYLYCWLWPVPIQFNEGWKEPEDYEQENDSDIEKYENQLK